MASYSDMKAMTLPVDQAGRIILPNIHDAHLIMCAAKTGVEKGFKLRLKRFKTVAPKGLVPPIAAP
jgi:hypothetical protein